MKVLDERSRFGRPAERQAGELETGRPTLGAVDEEIDVSLFEEAMSAPGYPLYAGEKLWAIMPAAAILKMFFDTFDDFLPRQPAPGFNPSAMLAKVYKAAAERQDN